MPYVMPGFHNPTAPNCNIYCNIAARVTFAVTYLAYEVSFHYSLMNQLPQRSYRPGTTEFHHPYNIFMIQVADYR